MQAVFYNVTGEGRAISITYTDNDGMMQTEFNVPVAVEQADQHGDDR